MFAIAIKDKNAKKIDKLKNTFQSLLSSKLGEIENEAIGQIREAKIKEEQALKNLQEKSQTLKNDYLTIHEHEKIVNEKMDYVNKRKAIEITGITEKFEQEMRHLKETFKLKFDSEKDKQKNKVKELTTIIEQLGKQL